MGGFTSKTQEDLKIYLERDYDIENYPLILLKTNKKKAFVHQITTDSREQAQRIRRDVNLYKHLACKSINNILEYIPLQSSKICSEQEYHYILEEREQIYNLKEQFLARKYYKEGFSHGQIIKIIKTYLCGLQVFHKQFHRNFKGNIFLESIIVDETQSNQLRMTDPLLISSPASNCYFQQSSTEQPQSVEEKALMFEAPQRTEQKMTRFNESKVDLNQLLADVYIVGGIALQLYKMQFFQKKQTHQTLCNQVQKVKDLQLKSLLNVMTAFSTNERAKIYQIIHVSRGESYCLEKSYRKGNLNGDIKMTDKQNIYQHPVSKIDFFQKQNSFSFGGSFDYQTTAVQGPTMTENRDGPKRNISNVKRSNNNKNEENGNLEFLNDKSFRYLNERAKDNKNCFGTENPMAKLQMKYVSKQSSSNMSTERTFTLPNLNTSRSTSKPIVKFNQSSSDSNLPFLVAQPNINTVSWINTNKLLDIKSYNLSQTKADQSQSINKAPIFPQQSSLVEFSSRSLYFNKIESLVAKQTIKPRPNSFLFTDDKKLPTKLIPQQNSIKKQQIESPISHYRHSQQKINSYQNNQQYNNYQPLVSSPSPNKLASNKKVEQQITKLLKQPPSNSKHPSLSATPLSHISNLSPILQQTIDFPINVLQNNQITKFTLKEKNSIDSNLSSIGQNLPVYRPNKQVEEILKRLGIGSLLYGEEEKKDQQNSKSILENIQEQTQSHQNLVHQGVYKISNPSRPLERSNLQSASNQNDQKDTHDSNQNTPIREPKKPKFNSTIVQVGDEDSQYSESVNNNEQVPADFSQHEFVVEQYETGSRYQGYKLNGQRDGQGKFFYQDGGYYEGQWRANKMHGWGKLYYEGGKLAYQGNWSQDEFHGFGKVYNDNPILLQCGFDFTNFDLLQDYWEYYQGMLVKDTKQGRGKIMLTNSEMFEGDFHNDRIQGFGKFFMKDGTIIEGIWRDSKLIKIIS